MAVTIWRTKVMGAEKKVEQADALRAMMCISLSYTMEGMLLHGFRPTRYQLAREQLISLGELTRDEEITILYKASQAAARRRRGCKVYWQDKNGVLFRYIEEDC